MGRESTESRDPAHHRNVSLREIAKSNGHKTENAKAVKLKTLVREMK